MTNRITSADEHRFVSSSVRNLSDLASTRTPNAVARVIRRQLDAFVPREGPARGQALFLEEEKALAALAAKEMAADWADSPTAFDPSEILRVLDALPEQAESLETFMAKENLRPETLDADLSRFSFSNKGVSGTDSHALAMASIRARISGPPSPLSVGDNAKKDAVAILRLLEDVRNSIEENHVVRSGDQAPDLDAARISRTMESMMIGAQDSGLLNGKGQIADPELRRAIGEMLRDHLIPKPDEWSLPLYPERMGRRSEAASAHDALTNIFIPAVHGYIKGERAEPKSLGPFESFKRFLTE